LALVVLEPEPEEAAQAAQLAGSVSAQEPGLEVAAAVTVDMAQAQQQPSLRCKPS